MFLQAGIREWEDVLMKLKYDTQENISGWLFVLPGFVVLAVFWIWPVIDSVYLSFTNWDMIQPTFKMVGFKNYAGLLTSSTFHQALKNTFVFAAGVTLPTLILGFMIAVILNQASFGVGIYRTIMFAPYITPMIAASIVWSWIYEPRVGILNALLNVVGLPGSKWNQSMSTAMLSVVIVTIWKQAGYTMVFYLEGIRKVPRRLLEAAEIDGATPFQRLIHIVLPMVSPTTFFLVIMSTIATMQAYDQIQVLTQGGPAGATRTVLYYYYQEAFSKFNTGKASAIALFLVIITVTLSLLETGVSRKMVHYDR